MSKILTLYSDYGQSVWLDYIDRNLLSHGGLRTLVAEGLRGVTSNPTIFHKAIAKSEDYNETILDLLQADPEMDVVTLYKWLTIEDVQMAADILAPVYKSSGGIDGFVSLEVSPHLAFDTVATIDEARQLWRAVNRPNLMIKVPATVDGVRAIEELIKQGINVNATLLFSVSRYKAVLAAYLRGLSMNPAPHKVASVASFFVSRIDTRVDAILESINTPESQALKGRIAVANATLAYRHFREMSDDTEFKKQQQRGARPQRPLWASTSTKNREYSDVRYVEELIFPNTVNTMPPETLDAFQAHGELRAMQVSDIDAPQRVIDSLENQGISLAQITDELEQEGVRKFAESYDQLLTALKAKRFVLARKYASG